MNKKQKEELEKKCQETKTPYDRAIKLCVKELSSLKSKKAELRSRINHAQQDEMYYILELEYFKNKAKEFSTNNKIKK